MTQNTIVPFNEGKKVIAPAKCWQIIANNYMQ